ncbi:MAG: hypothetical protein IPK26_02095 [Planctomycetes bacterium]|nr:hypothetical protein [Planctomycetota bacterium]
MRCLTRMFLAVASGLLAAGCGGSAPLPLEPMMVWRLPENAREFAELCQVHLGLELQERKGKDGIELCVPGERAAQCKPVLTRFKRELKLGDEPVPEAGPTDPPETRDELQRLREERRMARVVRAGADKEVLNAIVARKTTYGGKDAGLQSLLVALVVTDVPDAEARAALCSRVRDQMAQFEKLPAGVTIEVTALVVELAALRASLAAAAAPIGPATAPEPSTPASPTEVPCTVGGGDALVPPLPSHLWPVYGVAVVSLCGNVGGVLVWWRRRRRGLRGRGTGV